MGALNVRFENKLVFYECKQSLLNVFCISYLVEFSGAFVFLQMLCLFDYSDTDNVYSQKI